MSLRLNTGVMQYRESQNDVWKPMVIKTNLDWESLAEDYDATSDYEVGTYVLYNAELYRCTTAVPTGGEAWNAAHWIKVDFGSELNSLTEDVNELQEIAGDGALSGFTATNLTGAANELKNTLTQVENGLAIPQTGNTATRSIPASAFIFLTGNSDQTNLPDGIYQNTSGSAIGSGATFTTSNLTRCYQETGALNVLKNDSGSNYCKMPDGTLIQWGYLSLGSKSASQAGALYTATWELDSSTGAFPITFVGTYSVGVFPTDGSYQIIMSLESNYTKITKFGAARPTSGNVNGNFRYIAIGRWK